MNYGTDADTEPPSTDNKPPAESAQAWQAFYDHYNKHGNMPGTPSTSGDGKEGSVDHTTQEWYEQKKKSERIFFLRKKYDQLSVILCLWMQTKFLLSLSCHLQPTEDSGICVCHCVFTHICVTV
jgi:hypothetical protein